MATGWTPLPATAPAARWNRGGLYIGEETAPGFTGSKWYTTLSNAGLRLA